MRTFIDRDSKKPIYVSRDFVVTSLTHGGEKEKDTAFIYTQGQRFTVQGAPEAVAAELEADCGADIAAGLRAAHRSINDERGAGEPAKLPADEPVKKSSANAPAADAKPSGELS